jgi:excinuclease UvrABC nuclease subunit
MNLSQFKKLHIPDCPGVYSFKKDGEVLYIGKATSLRERLRSYFNPDLEATRGLKIVNMIRVADVIEFEKADSVLEAFIRETELIKKYLPMANSLAKDNKSFNYVVITDEDFPRVLKVRGRNIEQDDVPEIGDGVSYKYIFGPYPFGAELNEAMRIVRRIFPYRDTCTPAPEQIEQMVAADKAKLRADDQGPHRTPRLFPKAKPCFNATIGLCPGVCSGECTRAEYLKIINNIRLFFSGKKTKVLTNLRRQMMDHAKRQEFEKANDLKMTMFSLEHIKDISMIKRDGELNDAKERAREARRNATTLVSEWSGEQAEKIIRVESYDIAHMSGKDMVGVMCVSTDGEFDKSQYRKFIIQGYDASNDTGALTEVLKRRFHHREWKMPDVVIVDGGQAQLNAASAAITGIFREYEYEGFGAFMPYVISVVKDDAHKAREVLYAESDEVFINSVDSLISKNEIVRLNAETHRFAITFHKKKRGESFLPKNTSGKKPKDGK